MLLYCLPSPKQNSQNLVDLLLPCRRYAHNCISIEFCLQDNGCDYIIIHNKISNEEPSIFDSTPHLRKLKNVSLKTANNSCYDIGAMGLVLNAFVDIDQYNFFLFLNSSVRGPFYHRVNGAHWVDLFFSQLGNSIKLVGPTINCEPFMEMRAYPHVQTYCFATDSIGLKILIDAGIFNCYSDRLETIRNSEIGASRSVLASGYQITSLQQKYKVRRECINDSYV